MSRFLSILTSFSLFLLFGLHAGAEATKAEDYQYINVNKSPIQAGHKSINKKNIKSTKKKKTTRSVDNRSLPLAERAAAELIVPAEDAKELPTPATVRSTVDAVADPVARSAFDLGVTLEMFQPAGRVKLPGLDPYDLDRLSTRPMVGLEFRVWPWKLGPLPNTELGVFASVGYAQHPMNLKSPVGASIGTTELHSLRAQAGPALLWRPHLESLWSARVQMGIGQFSSTQSSASSYANRSSSETIASIGLFGERRFGDRYAVSIGYDYRAPLRGEPEEILLQRSNILAGLSGGFR